MRRDTWIPVAVLLLSAAFTLVSLLLAVTAGRSRPLLRAKLRLGGALLTLDRQHIADGLAEAKSDRTRLWEETRRLGDQLAEQREAVAYIKGWLDAMKEQK